MELIHKWLNQENRKIILRLINKWWNDETAPQEISNARVVPLYKKGETDNAANFRPISLLSSFYKIYMTLIRTIIQEGVENKICKTQHGFRPKKSTSHAIYLIRRLQDYAADHGEKLHMVFLDWGNKQKNTFDEILHSKLFLALERMGVSEKIINVLKHAYSNPQFYVKDNFGESKEETQGAGIRQGCPLSPYLFILVMACIDKDINREQTMRVRNNRVPGCWFDMVYYADDTILLSTDTKAIHELLKLTQEMSNKYGLNLNMDKCVAIKMNTEETIKFPNGTELKTEKQTTYLGNELIHNEDITTKMTTT